MSSRIFCGLLCSTRASSHDLGVELPGGHVHEADADGEAGAVGHDDLAVAVGDRAARRHDLDRAQAVVVGLGHELLAAEDLQEPQAEQDDAEQHQRQAEDDGGAQRHGRKLDDGPVATAGADRPVAAPVAVTEPERHADHPLRAATSAPRRYSGAASSVLRMSDGTSTRPRKNPSGTWRSSRNCASASSTPAISVATNTLTSGAKPAERSAVSA